MRKIVILTFVLILTSCMSTKKTEENNNEKAQTSIMDLSAEGFTYVETVTSKNVSPCDLLFKTEDGRMLEIVNFHDMAKEIETAYWIKFRGLRRMSKCKNAQPVEVTNIKQAELKLDK